MPESERRPVATNGRQGPCCDESPVFTGREVSRAGRWRRSRGPARCHPGRPVWQQKPWSRGLISQSSVALRLTHRRRVTILTQHPVHRRFRRPPWLPWIHSDHRHGVRLANRRVQVAAVRPISQSAGVLQPVPSRLSPRLMERLPGWSCWRCSASARVFDRGGLPQRSNYHRPIPWRCGQNRSPGYRLALLASHSRRLSHVSLQISRPIQARRLALTRSGADDLPRPSHLVVAHWHYLAHWRWKRPRSAGARVHRDDDGPIMFDLKAYHCHPPLLAPSARLRQYP